MRAFSITADLRVGGGTAKPADGFSFNFVRPDDPLLDDDIEDFAINTPDGLGNGWAEDADFPGFHLPEEGSTTGLAILFDTWQNGLAAPTGDCNEVNPATDKPFDCIGIGVRIDNELVTQTALLDLNGAFDNDESLTTNIDDDFLESGQAPMFELNEVHAGEGLTWAKLEIEYSESGNLLVKYKDREIINQPIEYEPSPGFLVFGGRTGGSNSYHHIDNISIRTTGLNAGGLRGDYDSNGLLEAADLDAMTELMLAGDLAADLDGDGDADEGDRQFWLTDLANTWVGDSNFDGEFNTGDFVQVFQAGKFESADAANWEEGDWTGDGKFDSSDFVFAFQNAGFEQGPREGGLTPGGPPAVPEPNSLGLWIFGAIAYCVSRRKVM